MEKFANYGFALGLLADKIYEEDGIESRVEFLTILYSGGKKCVNALNNGLFYEQGYGITERHYDTCFEMGDGDEVCKRIMEITKKQNSYLPEYIIKHYEKLMSKSKIV